MRTTIAIITRLILLSILTGFASAVAGQGFNLIRYDSFEEYPVGTSNLNYWHEQNCGTGPSCGNTCVDEPLIVTDEQARSGEKSLRFQRTNDDKVITGGSYCSARNEIANWNDAFATYGDHVWFGFSVYIADNHLQDRWSANNVTIFQFKNIDAGGGGNSFGSLKSYVSNGLYTWHMSGYGNIGQVVLNEWIDIVIHLKYGIDNDGIIEAWIGDKYIYQDKVSFPAKLACYPKFGSYSDILGPDVPMHKIYFDEIKFGKASGAGNYYDDVVPAFTCEETAAPAIPSDFSGYATGVREISLSWVDNSDNEMGYTIERKTEGEEYSFLAQLIQGSTNYTDKDVTDDNTYLYRLSSYNCYGSSTPVEAEIFLEKDHTQLLPIHGVSASTHLGNYIPENAVDDKLNTYWLVDGEEEWLQLELSHESNVERVSVGFINGNSRFYNFHIDVSMDGEKWSRAGSFTSSGEDNNLNDFVLDGVPCKYVRFVTGTNTVDERTWLAEIQLWGFASTPVNEIMEERPFHIQHSRFTGKIEVIIHDESLHNSIVSIYNLLGMLAGSYSTQGNSTSIDVNGFTPGIYLIHLKSSNRKAVQKVWIY